MRDTCSMACWNSTRSMTARAVERGGGEGWEGRDGRVATAAVQPDTDPAASQLHHYCPALLQAHPPCHPPALPSLYSASFSSSAFFSASVLGAHAYSGASLASRAMKLLNSSGPASTSACGAVGDGEQQGSAWLCVVYSQAYCCASSQSAAPCPPQHSPTQPIRPPTHPRQVAKVLLQRSAAEVAVLGGVRLADQAVAQHAVALVQPQARHLAGQGGRSEDRMKSRVQKVRWHSSLPISRHVSCSTAHLQRLLEGLLGHAAQALRDGRQLAHGEVVVEADCGQARRVRVGAAIGQGNLGASP